MKTFKFYQGLLALFLCCSTSLCGLSACSDDDDAPQGGDIDFGVPPSVVDGVRPSELSGMRINYNEDGTIRDAEVDGCTFVFNYVGTRAASRRLTSITAERNYDDSKESWIADRFILDANGFIGGYRLKYSLEEPSEDWWEKGEMNYRYNYQANGYLERIDLSGHFSDAEDEATSGSGSYNYSYSQTGQLLNIKSVMQGYTYCEQKYTYGIDHNNKYNTMLLTLAPEPLMADDAVFRILAVTGYLGHASKKLPSKVEVSYRDPEDPAENSDETWALNYGFSPDERINWYSVNGQRFNCKFVDASNIEIQH